MDWLPIESAPKDGSTILLGRAESIDGEVSAVSTPGFWQEGCDDGVDTMGFDDGFVDHEFQTFNGGRSMGNEKYKYPPNQPTHWMPLPPPPEQNK